jgi:hypothetical protein
VSQLLPVNRNTTLNQEKQEVKKKKKKKKKRKKKKKIASIVSVFCSDNFIPNYASKNLSIKNHTCARKQELSRTSNRKHTERLNIILLK